MCWRRCGGCRRCPGVHRVHVVQGSIDVTPHTCPEWVLRCAGRGLFVLSVRGANKAWVVVRVKVWVLVNNGRYERGTKGVGHGAGHGQGVIRSSGRVQGGRGVIGRAAWNGGSNGLHGAGVPGQSLPSMAKEPLTTGLIPDLDGPTPPTCTGMFQ